LETSHHEIGKKNPKPLDSIEQIIIFTLTEHLDLVLVSYIAGLRYQPEAFVDIYAGV
jgi:hypothetical protein